MSTENNKQLVRKAFFEQLVAGDIDGYLASVADDYTHTIPVNLRSPAR